MPTGLSLASGGRARRCRLCQGLLPTGAERSDLGAQPPPTQNWTGMVFSECPTGSEQEAAFPTSRLWGTSREAEGRRPSPSDHRSHNLNVCVSQNRNQVPLAELPSVRGSSHLPCEHPRGSSPTHTETCSFSTGKS